MWLLLLEIQPTWTEAVEKWWQLNKSGNPNQSKRESTCGVNKEQMPNITDDPHNKTFYYCSPLFWSVWRSVPFQWVWMHVTLCAYFMKLQSRTKVLRKLFLQISCSCKIPSPLLPHSMLNEKFHPRATLYGGGGVWLKVLTRCLPTFKLNIRVLWIFSRGFVPDCRSNHNESEVPRN